MSYIPNSAMPHAGHIEEIDDEEFDEFEASDFDEEEEQPSRRARVREMVRERPKTSIAAGAALIAGLAAAAAIPFLNARDRKSSPARKRRPSAKSAASESANGKSANGSSNARSTNGSGARSKSAGSKTASSSTKSGRSKSTGSTRKPAAKRSSRAKNGAPETK